MTAILVVRPSSLGDIVHASALVADVLREAPRPRHRLGRRGGFRAARRARSRRAARDPRRACGAGAGSMLSSATWREMAAFRHELRREDYAAVLDLQEQVKGALIAGLARGPRHGPDRASIREPIATLAHNAAPCDRSEPAPDRPLPPARRGRAPLSRSTGRRASASSRRRAGTGGAMPDRPYMIFLHSTSRADKLWPEANWRALIGAFAQAGFGILLPWGDARRARAQRAPRQRRIERARVPPRQSLRRTRRTHRARRARRRRRHGARASRRGARHADGVAVRRDRSAPRRRRTREPLRPRPGRHRTGAHRRRRARRGRRAAARRAARIGRQASATMRALYTLLWYLALPFLPLRLLVARAPRTRLPRAHRRALRPIPATTCGRRDRRALGARGVARRNARRRAARRSAAPRLSRRRRCSSRT